jgi:hypothetical protein
VSVVGGQTGEIAAIKPIIVPKLVPEMLSHVVQALSLAFTR